MYIYFPRALLVSGKFHRETRIPALKYYDYCCTINTLFVRLLLLFLLLRMRGFVVLYSVAAVELQLIAYYCVRTVAMSHVSAS